MSPAAAAMRIQSRPRRNATSAGSDRPEAARKRGRRCASLDHQSVSTTVAGGASTPKYRSNTLQCRRSGRRSSRGRRSRSARRRRAAPSRTGPIRTTRTGPRGGRSGSREAARPSPRFPSCPRSGPGSWRRRRTTSRSLECVAEIQAVANRGECGRVDAGRRRRRRREAPQHDTRRSLSAGLLDVRRRGAASRCFPPFASIA